MRSIKLIGTQDTSFGGVGLLINGMARDESVNPSTDGLGIAHDLIEHVNGLKHIGGIDDELEALGAIWYVRGQFNDLRRDGRGSLNSVYENIASDITRMFRDYIYGVPAVQLIPRTHRTDEDDSFEEILKCAERDYITEIDDDERDEATQKWVDFKRAALSRMRIGYRKAARKYKHDVTANTLFWLIADAVDKYAKCAEEGQIIRLRYGIDARGVPDVEVEVVDITFGDY